MTTTVPRTQSPVRDRLIDSASRQFYADGIHAVSADRVIADVGTTKATFYRHFPTKDDLVLAYLEGQAAQERAEMTDAASPDDPRRALDAVVGVLADAGCDAGFRGCPFINAAAEYPDPTHPVRRLVAEHRQWWFDFFRDLAQRLGVSAGGSADVVAGQILMLRDGALFAGYVDGPKRVQASLAPAIDAVLGLS